MNRDSMKMPYADGGEGGGGVNWAQWLTPQLVLTLAAVLLVLLLILSLIGWRIYRRVRRSGALERGLLAVRAQALPPGAARELAELRHELNVAISSTELMIGRADTADSPAADLTLLLGGLKSAAAGLDVDLRMLEREPDPGQQSAGLALYRPQAEQLIDAAAQTRRALTQTAALEQQTRLRELGTQVTEQASALQAYRQAYRELGGGNG